MGALARMKSEAGHLTLVLTTDLHDVVESIPNSNRVRLGIGFLARLEWQWAGALVKFASCQIRLANERHELGHVLQGTEDTGWT
jgi:hypothetical protein